MTWQDWVEAGTRAGGRTEPSPERQDGTSKRRRDTTVFFPSQSPPTFLPKAGKRISLVPSFRFCPPVQSALSPLLSESV